MAVNDKVDIMRQSGTSEEDCANALNDFIKKQVIKARLEQIRTNAKMLRLRTTEAQCSIIYITKSIIMIPMYVGRS